MSARLSAEEFYNSCLNTPLDMVLMRRIFLLLTRVHWSDVNNHYQDPNPFDCLVYSDIEADSRLPVELTDIYDENDTDNFPGIFVGFKGGYTLQKISINYDSGSSDDYAKDKKQVSWRGKLHISHVHSSSDIALAMADSTFVFMMAVRESLMGRFPIRLMDIVGVSDPTRINPESANRFFKVDLVVDIEFTAAVSVSLESHRLKKWGLKLNPAYTD